MFYFLTTSAFLRLNGKEGLSEIIFVTSSSDMVYWNILCPT